MDEQTWNEMKEYLCGICKHKKYCQYHPDYQCREVINSFAYHYIEKLSKLNLEIGDVFDPYTGRTLL